MILGHTAFVVLVLMGLLATLLVGMRMSRPHKEGLAPYKDADKTAWRAFCIHTLLWVALYWLVT